VCGIVGVTGNLFGKEVGAFNDMLTFNQVRGNHSTGVAGFTHRASEGQMIKRIGPPCDLMDMKQYDSVVNTGKYVLIGHGRHATMGGIKNSNAHPFSHGAITGVHNGSLRGSWRSNLKDSHKFDTDSEALIYSLATVGLEDTMAKLEGAWALVWYDSDDKTLNFIRNDERPLCYGVVDDGRCVFFASESMMIRAALARRDIKCDKIMGVQENVHYKWSMPDHNGEYAVPTKRRIPVYTPPPYVGGYRPGDSVGQHSGTGSTAMGGGRGHLVPVASNGTPSLPGLGAASGPTSHLGEREPRFPDSQAEKAIAEANKKAAQGVQKLWMTDKWKPPYKDQGSGMPVTRPQFNQYVSEGCAWCTNVDNVWGDRVAFLGKDDRNKMQFVCETCLMDEETRDIIGVK